MSARPNQLTDFLIGITSPYVVMGVGLPKSGKEETLGRMASDLDVRRIRTDDVRSRMAAIGVKGAGANEAIKEEVAAILEAGEPVIVDGRHIDSARTIDQVNGYSRSQLVEAYRDFGAQAVMALAFKIPIERIIQRSGHSTHPTPNELRGLYRNLAQHPVSLNEGFDLIAQKNDYSQPVVITDVRKD
jgi:predicted kinase